MKVDKIRDYLFIAYEMYVKERSKEWLDNELNGIELLFEIDDFKRWMVKEGIKLN